MKPSRVALPFVILFAVFVTPSWGGANAQLVKVFLLALGALVCFQGQRLWQFSHGRSYALAGVGAMACLAFLALSSWISPVHNSTWLWFWGSSDRVDGIMPLAAAMVFALYGFWPRTCAVDEDQNELYGLNAACFSWCLGGVVSFSFIGAALKDMEWLGWTIGRELGVGMIAGVIAPYFFARLWSERRPGMAALWFSLMNMAVILCIKANYRCAMVGLGVSALWVVVAYRENIMKGWSAAFTRGRVICLCAIGFGASVVVALSPSVQQKIAGLSISGIGRGGRAELIAQAYEKGVPPWGWGWNSQLFLIDRYRGDGLENTRFEFYDRWHNGIVDAVMCFGPFVGGFAIFLVVIAFWIAWQRRGSPHHIGLAAMLASFLVSIQWNPPTIQLIALAMIAWAGIMQYNEPPCYNSPRLRRVDFWGRLAIAPLSAVLGLGVLADNNMEGAKHRWANEGTTPNHVLLARMWYSTKFNPYMDRDYVWAYYRAMKDELMVEPYGGKAMLLDQLRKAPERNYALEALLWGGLKDYDAQRRAWRKALWHSFVVRRQGRQ